MLSLLMASSVKESLSPSWEVAEPAQPPPLREEAAPHPKEHRLSVPHPPPRLATWHGVPWPLLPNLIPFTVIYLFTTFLPVSGNMLGPGDTAHYFGVLRQFPRERALRLGTEG